MADARSLLRQQRASRRIDQPHAAYTEAGKLLCTLCRELIKAESLWEGHVQGEDHRRRLLSGADRSGGPARTDGTGVSHKRKLDDGQGSAGGLVVEEDAVRRKRSRPDLAVATPNGSGKDASSRTAADQASGSNGNSNGNGTLWDHNLTPPSLSRRASTTPSQGVELQIPSRPATPSRRDASSSSTPAGLTPSLPSQGSSAGSTFLLPRKLGGGSFASPAGDAPSAAAATTTTTSSSTAPSGAGTSSGAVDEAEWAAFEADIAAAATAQTTQQVDYDTDAVISAPVMTAEESAAAAAAAKAAQSQDERLAQADVDVEDERDEASRAIEDEFSDMRQLEARVARLKEKREALRRGVAPAPAQDASSLDPMAGGGRGRKEGSMDTTPAPAVNGMAEDKENEDDDDEDDEDDWDAFRFRTS